MQREESGSNREHHLPPVKGESVIRGYVRPLHGISAAGNELAPLANFLSELSLYSSWPKKGSRVDSVSRLKLRGRRLLEHFQHHSVLRTPSVFNRLRASSDIRIPEGLRTPRTGAPVAHVFARMGLVHSLTSAMTSPKL